jgi:RNA polymerase sigma-70 factor (ECF subfamily)
MAAVTESTEPDSLTDLVRAAQSGDRQAQGELFERYERHLLAIALRRLRDYGEAQDLVQEVFVQALQKLRQLRTPECFGGWLRAITIRMAINRAVRTHRALHAQPLTLDAACAELHTPDDCAIEGERAECVRDGLRRLRALDRDTLVAFYVRGQSLLEMSDVFEAPVGTIKRRLHVARQRLAREIEHLVSA